MNTFGALVRRKPSSVVLCVVGVLILAIRWAGAAEYRISINDVVKETQKSSEAAGKLAMAWWLPDVFWRASFQQDDSMTEASIDEFLSVLRPYVVIAAADGTIGPFGGATFKDKDSVRKSIILVDKTGAQHSPLNEDQVSSDARNFSQMMTPILANMLGNLGKNLHFFFFPAVTQNGDRIAEAATPGSFSVEMGGEMFQWKLPLGSALPPKVCPQDEEEMNGAWSYCPWHGKKLVIKKAEDDSKGPEGTYPGFPIWLL